MATRITLPEMGEGVIEGTIARWLVQEGEHIEKFAPIAEVETDKVTTETTSEAAGTVLKLCVPEGETVPVGTILAYIGEPGETISENGDAEVAARSLPSQPAKEPGRQKSGETGVAAVGYKGRISPVVGRIASEHGVDLGKVNGTGRDGRITKNDILAYVEAKEAGGRDLEERERGLEPRHGAIPSGTSMPGDVSPIPSPAVVRAEPGSYELLPLTSIRRSIAEHMVRSKQTSPHVTTVFEVDFSVVSAHLQANKHAFARDGARLTYTAYIVAAVVQALKAHPLVNSSWSDDGIRVMHPINIGMATAIDDGLIVPVIKGADGMNLLGLSRAINDLADRARSKQLKPDEVKGGTFSLTNHGTTGSLFATPIINQPQCGILGVGAIEKRVKVIDDAIAIRPQAYVSFTFDHRILDGASADNFVSTIKRQIEDWR